MVERAWLVRVVGVKHNLGASSFPAEFILLGFLTGNRRLCIQGRVFVSGKARPEGLRNSIPSNCFLGPVNEGTNAEEVCPHRTDNRKHGLTWLGQLHKHSEHFRVLERMSPVQCISAQSEASPRTSTHGILR